MEYVGLLLALPVGFILGLLGGGGSILAVPVFVYVLGIDPKLAMAASLGVVGATSFVGAWPHARAGNLDLRTAALFAVSSVVGSFAGTQLGLVTPNVVRMMVFGGVMLGAAVMMLRRSGKKPEGEGRRSSLALLIAGGLGVGILIGFVGVGGGFMYVPALVFLVGMPMNRAVGTSLVIIGFSSAVALAANLLNADVRGGFADGRLGDMSLTLALIIFTALTFVGVIAGGTLAGRVKPEGLRRGFAIFLIVTAVGILIREGIGM